MITKDEITEYIEKALKKDTRVMIHMLVRQVVLYNDKIEIYYNYTDRKSPDGEENRQGFLFYSCKKEFEINQRKFDGKTITLNYTVELFI